VTATVPLRPGWSPGGFYVQLLAFTRSARMLSSADLGGWQTDSGDEALEQLRLFVQSALIPMGEAAALSALRWSKAESAARQVRETLDAGGMYVHVIADGTTFYEISARPLVFPAGDEDRHGTWFQQQSVVAGKLTGVWSA
jgi:hypothetical protein